MKNNLYKVLALLLCLTMTASLLLGAAPAGTDGEERVYETVVITTPEDLLAFAKNCVLDAWSRDKQVLLAADLSLAGVDFEPIPGFSGIFDGQGHTISGLAITSSAAPSGLFGQLLEGGVIRDLTLEGSILPSGDGRMAGGLVGNNCGSIENCRFTGTISAKSSVGGLVGLNSASGTVSGCVSMGGVSGSSMTGGIVGKNEGRVRNCENRSFVNIESADPNLNLDGLSLRGLLSSAEDYSLSLINVATDTGGIAGYSTGTVSGCVNRGTVGYQHIGYNVGGVIGRSAGYVESCRNEAEVQGRRDIGGIVGQMEPLVSLVLTEDTAQTLQSQLSGLNYLLGVAAEDARASADASADRLSAIAGTLAPILDAAYVSEEPFEISRQLAEFMGTFYGIMGQLNDVSAEMHGGAQVLADDMQRVISQIGAVNSTLTRAMGDLNDVSGDVLTDTSEENVDAVTDGKVFASENSGSIYGDINVGGIAGCMGIESSLDPEGDSPNTLSAMLHREFETKSIIQSCVNRGAVTAKKDCVGAVCGSMELGLIIGCEGYGTASSESGNYVGGIVGETAAVVRNSYSKCALSGGNYVGGIAGAGSFNSSTGVKSTLAECRALVKILRYKQYAGAIAGAESGDFVDNYFVSDEFAGVNRMNYLGRAEPLSYAQMLTLDGTPDTFRELKLEFRIDGETVKTIAFPYGSGFDASIFPTLPAREGYYGTWDVTDLSSLYFDTVVNAVYVPNITSLRSAQERGAGRPIFFVEGAFREGDTLIAYASETAATLSEIAGRAPSAAELLRAGLRGRITHDTGVGEQWHLTIPDDGSAVHTVRFVTATESVDGADIYIDTGSGWRKVACDSFGSYLTFPVSGTEVELAVVRTGQAWWVYLVYALAMLAVLALLISLIRAIRSAVLRRRMRQAARQGNGPVAEAAPARKPRRRRSAKERFVLTAISLLLVLIALGVTTVLRSDARNGLSLLSLIHRQLSGDDVNMTISANIVIGSDAISSDFSAFKTKLNEDPVYCLQIHGASIYYSKETMYLENGRSFHIGYPLPTLGSMLGTVLSLQDTIDISARSENGKTIYTVVPKSKDTNAMLSLLFPAISSRLDTIDTLQIDVTAWRGQIEEAQFVSDGTLEGAVPYSVSAVLHMAEPDPIGNTVPAAVKTAMKAPSSAAELELTDELIQLLYGWAALNARDPLILHAQLGADCGSLIVNDDLTCLYTVVNNTTVSAVRAGGVTLYYANGRACSASGAEVRLPAGDLTQSGELLELAYQLCMNSAVSCVKDDDGNLYTVILSGEKLLDLMCAIAPQAERLNITPGYGSVEVLMKNEQIESVSFRCSGTLTVALSKLDASFDAKLTMDEGNETFPVPEAVIAALTEK